MGLVHYRIPDTGLFMLADGSISPKVEPGASVADLTSANADVLRVAYHGRALQRLGFLSAGGGGDNMEFGEQTHTIRMGIRAVKLVPFGKEYIEFVDLLNEMVMGPLGQPDPMMESLNRIHQLLSEIRDFNLAAWVTAREDNLAFLMSHSSTALHTANTFVKDNGSRSDPVWAAKIAIAERDSLLAVHTFTADMERGFWLRPYSLAAISQSGDPTTYYSGWMPHMPDRAAINLFSQVWDYRWALPALVYAITARLLVITALGTGSRTEKRLRCAEVKGYVGFLQRVFKKRSEGLRTIENLTDLQVNDFRNTGRFPMAAVDLYGGDFIGGIFFSTNAWPPMLAPGLVPPWMGKNTMPPLSEAAVASNLKAFSAHWWSLLYVRTGLEDLLLFISELQSICDEPWFSRTYADVHEKISLIRADDQKRRTAQLAASLSKVSRTENSEARASQTHVLYQALTGGGDRARKIVANCVRELSRLEVTEESVPKPTRRNPPATAVAKRARKGA